MPEQILEALKNKNNITIPYEVFDILSEWIDECVYNMNMNQSVGKMDDAEKWRKSALEVDDLIEAISSPFTGTERSKLKELDDGINE